MDVLEQVKVVRLGPTRSQKECADDLLLHEIVGCAPKIFRFAASRVGPDQAEDVTSETLASAWASRARFERRTDKSVDLWLFGIANNMLRRHKHSEARWIEMRGATGRMLDETTGEWDGLHGAEERSDAQQCSTRLAKAVNGLPRRERDPLLLFAIQELTYEQIAVALGIPVGTVRSRISRGRNRVAKQLARRGLHDV